MYEGVFGLMNTLETIRKQIKYPSMMTLSVKIPIPLNAEEACLSFYALHDLWNADLELSLAVKERMMKTYTQRTWRKQAHRGDAFTDK
jgi:hypothetical protein